MSQHTPGPWQAEDEGDDWLVTASDDGRPSKYRNDPWNIATVHGGCGDCENESEANARLIAAAPDLLNAILKSDDAHWTPAMRAAIAKATGAP